MQPISGQHFVVIPKLPKIFVKILSLPATSVAVKRTLSTYKDVQSLKTNWLLNRKANKHNLQVNIMTFK